MKLFCPVFVQPKESQPNEKNLAEVYIYQSLSLKLITEQANSGHYQ